MDFPLSDNRRLNNCKFSIKLLFNSWNINCAHKTRVHWNNTINFLLTKLSICQPYNNLFKFHVNFISLYIILKIHSMYENWKKWKWNKFPFERIKLIIYFHSIDNWGALERFLFYYKLLYIAHWSFRRIYFRDIFDIFKLPLNDLRLFWSMKTLRYFLRPDKKSFCL